MSEEQDRRVDKRPLSAVSNLLSSVFFIGFIPFAPGTFGSLAGALFIFILKPSYLIHLLLIAMVLLVGLWSSEQSESCWGKDSKKIVIDEFLGQMVALLFVPLSLTNLLASFALFRSFDILKPYPIKALERGLKGGPSIIFDDVLSGVAANLTLQVALCVT